LKNTSRQINLHLRSGSVSGFFQSADNVPRNRVQTSLALRVEMSPSRWCWPPTSPAASPQSAGGMHEEQKGRGPWSDPGLFFARTTSSPVLSPSSSRPPPPSFSPLWRK